jgi:gliding motility-associated-like protein
MKIKNIILLILFTSSFISLKATHNRAGEITFRQKSEFTYEIKIVTYTNTKPDELGRLPADRPSLEIDWGDNTSSTIARTKKIDLANYYRYNEYVMEHTYPGPGNYMIFVQDPNRNQGVKNIPNPLQTVFAIDTKLVINAELGYNNTPVLLSPPVDKAAVNRLFIHNPAAYDIDGDSLSYSFTPCRGEDGQPIQGYKLPPASNKIYIDSVNGDLIWDTPMEKGLYNIAMNITEWRKGVKISNIIRDMQIEVVETDNNPPQINTPENICVIAGDTVNLTFEITDPDKDFIRDTLIGGPFKIEPNTAVFKKIHSEKGLLRTSFSWVTNCNNIRKEPYKIVIKAEDYSSSPNFISLVDIDHFDISVLGPPVDSIVTFAYNNAILLKWKKYNCSNIKGYSIYRKEHPTGFIPDKCETGVPISYGFNKIATVKGLNKNYFFDNDNGKGLQQGYEYCYRIVAVFNDDSESKSSEEICSFLVPPIPIITNVSVTNHSETNGKIYIAWLKPKHLDTLKNANGPYLYKIYRSNDLYGLNFTQIASLQTSDLSDTTYVDSLINTINYPYSYKIELWNNEPGNTFLIGNPCIASSLYSKINTSDNRLDLQFIKNTPWVNNSYDIYRKNSDADTFRFINSVNNTDLFSDKNLLNNHEYCYKIISHGVLLNHDKQYFYNQNISHINCGMPIDTIAPCPPVLSVVKNCDSLSNSLSWIFTDFSCCDDVVGYKIYYASQQNDKFTLLKEIDNKNTYNYIHNIGKNPLGCYYITAIDSFNNESIPSNTECSDVCINYRLPNVFSPNADNINEVYHALGIDETILKVDMKIFNRWGQIIFKTSDPYINWKGEIEGSNKIVPSGIYYYICDVYINGITGERPVNMVGFIYVYTDKKIVKPAE